MAMIVNCAAYSEGRRVGDIAISEISETLARADTCVWLGLHEPDEKLMKQVQEEFGLHDLAVEDAHRAHQRPKLETYGDSLFVVLHTAQLWEGDIHFGETHIFVGPRYVVTVRHGPSAPYTQVRTRCESTPELLAKGPGFVLYALMDFVVDHYMPIVESFEDELESLEDAIFVRSGARKTTERIYDLKRELVKLRRALAPVAEMCHTLNRSATGLILEDTHPYFRDIGDHVARMLESVEQMRELLTTALQVNLSLASIGQSEVMKRLAGWAALLAVPTLVASLYGMNFEYMPELEWAYGYPIVVGVTLIACLLLYRRLKRAEWL
ncbi:MAG: magnesium and cobalt transport protein CorA [Betaproteobacteria bacterium RIFCSPLOWO2_12_FULL_62_13]|nr:MAG: magnesium and cobalt transport protein CorA [Betaproteobacteria bacterium RIFCSPLOWO2_12_FULL_62_13]